MRFRGSNDIERSRRVVRFLFTNWLAQVDKPAAERAAEQNDRRISTFMISIDRAARGSRNQPGNGQSSDRRDASGPVDVSCRTSTAPTSMNPPSARGKATAFLPGSGSGDRC